MRILFLSRWYPYPPDNGSKIRVFGLLRGLCQQHDVTLISFRDPAQTVPDATPSNDRPRVTRLCPYREFAPQSSRALLGFLSTTPRYLVDTYNPEMDRLIRDAVRDTRFDLVIASQLSMAAYHQSFKGIPAIFEEVELGIYLPEGDPSQPVARRVRRATTWAKHRRFMARLLDNFMLCTVVSDVERKLLAAAVPGYRNVHVVPNSVDAQPPSDGRADRPADSLIFTGSLRYAPNHDAMSWFLADIFPAIRARVPGARLTITGEVGSHAPAPSSDLVLTGHVADVRSLVARSAISIAPIRLGGGTRLKILEAMAVRTPVVATTKAAEGLGARHGEHLLIADTPREFAAAVSSLLHDPARARDMAERAWGFCQARYDSAVVIPQFLRLVDHATAA
jgi:polysaccharide biosynthesis protein PslH